MASQQPAWRSGETVVLTSLDGRVELRLLLEWRGGSSFAFAMPEAPYRRLKVTKAAVGPRADGLPLRVHFDNGLDLGRYAGGKDAAWEVRIHDIPEGDGRRAHCVTLNCGGKNNAWYLAAAAGDHGDGGAGELRLVRSSDAVVVDGGDSGGRHAAEGPERSPSPTPGAPGSDRPLRSRVRCIDEVLWSATAVGHVAAPPAVEEAVGEAALGESSDAAVSDAQLLQFAQQGYLQLHQVVPAAELQAAKAFVNAKLAQALFGTADDAGAPPAPSEEPSAPPRAPPPTPSQEEDAGLQRSAYTEQEYFAEPGERLADPAGSGTRGVLHQAFGASSPQLMSLARCAPVARILEHFIGDGKVDYRCGAQVALRFPGVHDDLVAGGAAVRTKVTGRDWHTDGLRQGKKHSFSLLLGIALSDSTEENTGNLCVWPESHHFCHARMRDPDGKIYRDTGWEPKDGPLPDLGPPTQLCVRAGDVVLAHSELGHCGGPHLGSDIRYMVYFRVRHTGWSQMRKDSLLLDDMFVDLEGLRRLRDQGLLPQTPAPVVR